MPLDYDERGLPILGSWKPDPVDTKAAQPAAEAPAVEGIARPPGLLGELSDYFWSSSVRPVLEVSLAAALGLTAGVCGRQYNISGSGLNQYLMLTAKTGRGKSGLEDGIDRIVSAVRPELPMVDQFIGPGSIASGQALHRHLADHPCFVATLGEFGLTLQQLCHPRASEVQVGLRKTLLHLYAKSGQDKTLRGGIYASKDNNIPSVPSPALTILCEGTPGTFFDAIDEHLVAQGLVSRFLILDYDGDRPPPNKNRPAPHESLLLHFKDLVHSVLSMEQSGHVVEVRQTPEAEAQLDEYGFESDRHINTSGAVEAELYNRAHLHALKLAALVAVGCDHHQPVVTVEHAQWAINIVRRSVHSVLRRFETGEVGGDNRAKAEAIVRKRIATFLAMTPDERAKDDKIPNSMHAGIFIPRAYLVDQTKRLQPFKGDRFALTNTLNEMVKNGDLVKLSEMDARTHCKSRGGEVYAANWVKTKTFY